MPLIHDYQYLIVFENSTEAPPIDCSSLQANFVFKLVNDTKAIKVVNTTFIPHIASTTCYLNWKIDEMLEGPIKPYLDEPAFYWNPDSNQVDNRFFITIVGLDPKINLIYRTMGNDTHVTVAGKTKVIRSSVRTRSKSVFIETFKLLRFADDPHVSFFNLYSPERDTSDWWQQDVASNVLENFYYIPDGVTMIYFTTLGNAEYYHRYPDTIIMGLSKIGGLLALLKLGAILHIIHHTLFRRNLFKGISDVSIK